MRSGDAHALVPSGGGDASPLRATTRRRCWRRGPPAWPRGWGPTPTSRGAPGRRWRRGPPGAAQARRKQHCPPPRDPADHIRNPSGCPTLGTGCGQAEPRGGKRVPPPMRGCEACGSVRHGCEPAEQRHRGVLLAGRTTGAALTPRSFGTEGIMTRLCNHPYEALTMLPEGIKGGVVPSSASPKN